jgi:hypothetical protein
MSKISVQVWHSADGQIIAIGRPAPERAKGIVPTVAGAHAILETDVDEYQIPELHRTHAVDVGRGRLVPQAGLKDRGPVGADSKVSS